MRMTALAAALMLASGTASAATTGFTLVISGNDQNIPTLSLTNISTTAMLTEFSMTIGDTSRNFDQIYTITAPAGGSATLIGGSSSQSGNNSASGRTNAFSINFSGFDPSEFARWDVDVDIDNDNTVEDYRSVFFNNGTAQNSLVSALFSDGRTVDLTLPDGANDLSSYTFTAATQVSAVPVPAALPLLATALGALGFASRRRNG